LTPEKQLELYKELCQYYMNNDQDELKKFTDKGLALAIQEKNNDLIGDFYRTLGVYHYYQANYDTSLIYFEKSLEIVQVSGDKNKEALLYTNIALMYSLKGDFSTEIEYNLKALSIYETIDDNKHFITLLVNLGTTYRSLRDHERALYYFDRANRLAEETNYAHGKILVYYAYANVYYDKKDYKETLNYYLKSITICREENNKHFLILCLQSLATFYTEAKDYIDIKKAEEYATESLQIATEFGDPFRIRGSLRVLAYIYLKQKRYQDCESLATQAWRIDSIDIDTSHGLASMLTVSNIHLNNQADAEYYFYKYVQLNDEKSLDNLQQTLIDLEAKYQSEKKEIRITSLERERKLFVWLGVAGVLMVVALGIVLLQRIRNIRKEQRLIASEAIQEGEIGERTRIAKDLHDRLGNSLTAVKIGLSNAESLQNISEKLDMCMKEVREITNNVMPRSLHLFGMKGALEDFCTRYTNVHFYFFGAEQRAKPNLEYTVYCCARELVNNALKHAGATTINMQLVQSKKYVSLTVQDDGCGFDERTVIKGDGLQNIRNRVASCRGKIDISSSDKGTEIVLAIKTEN
jgi:signal transduction histidine kinase